MYDSTTRIGVNTITARACTYVYKLEWEWETEWEREMDDAIYIWHCIITRPISLFYNLSNILQPHYSLWRLYWDLKAGSSPLIQWIQCNGSFFYKIWNSLRIDWEAKLLFALHQDVWNLYTFFYIRLMSHHLIFIHIRTVLSFCYWT